MSFTDYDISTPDGSIAPPSSIDDRIRESKLATQQREDVDHYWPRTDKKVNNAETGEHRKLTIRTLTAEEVAALDEDKSYLYRLVTDGELYFQDGAGNTIKLTVDGVLNVLFENLVLSNNAYLKANAVDSGTIDIVKVDTDNRVIVRTAVDRPTRFSTAAPPLVDNDISNKKYVDDKVAANHPSYTGDESHTDGSGLIIKMGYVARSGASTTVTFKTAFPGNIVSFNFSPIKTTLVGTEFAAISTLSKAACVIKDNSAYSGFYVTGYYWIAIGY